MSSLAIPAGLELPRIPGIRDLLDHVGEKLGELGLRGELKGVNLDKVGFSNAAELIVLDSVLNDHTTNLYTTPHLALTTVAVGETDTGATLTEAAYTGYARKAIAAADLSPAAAGSKTNSAALIFAACTAGSAVVIGWAVVNSAAGAGDVILFGTCTSTTISTTQTPPQVAAGVLIANLD